MNRRFYFFTRVWATLAIALIAATWRLWTPQTQFPQIPFFEILVNVPGWMDWIALTIVGLSLLVCLLRKPLPVEPGAPAMVAPDQAQRRGINWFRISHLSFTVAITYLILLDQNRLQPWAYHFLIIGFLIGLAKPRTATSLIRWIAISIYVYSAISKFDYQFVHTVGDQMISTIFGFIGVETTNWNQELKGGLVLLLPLGELLVGIGLALPRFRSFAAAAAIGLHVALLIILGPWGLNHQPGVLIWNLFFIFQALILFWANSTSNDPQTHTDHSAAQGSRENSPHKKASYQDRLALLVAAFALCFPLTQWIGICDHWPAWQVYSPSSSRAQLLNDRPVSQWSLEELGVPVYPQSRFQMAVAFAAAEKAARDEQGNGRLRFQIELKHQSNRFTGKRNNEMLTGPDQFKMKKSGFWLNTRARKNWFD